MAEGGKAVKKDPKIQDAHEAIRPTDICKNSGNAEGISFKRSVPPLSALYGNDFTASRMAPARYETTSVKIGAGEYTFTVSASKVVF